MSAPVGFLFLFLSLSVPFALGQTLSSSFSGCLNVDPVTKEATVIGSNETFADQNWWYQCVGTTLIARGCISNGMRYDVGDTYLIKGQSFYGRCDMIDDRYLRSTVLGCVDSNGRPVDPGRRFMLSRYFWAECTTQSSTAGSVELQVIGRRIVGCNDGTYDIVEANNNFPDIRTDKPLLAGVGLICRMDGPYPQVEPVVCLVANSTKDFTYATLGAGCYDHFRDYLYYCSIEQRPLGNGTVEYAWEIGWSSYDDQNTKALQSKSFKSCSSSGNSTATTSSRRKREHAQLSTLVSMIDRYDRVTGWLEASSTFIEM